MRKTFREKIFYDEFIMAAGLSFRTDPAWSYKKICEDTLCCLVRFSRDLEGVKVGVFRGLHTVAGQYFLEVCLVTNIPPSANIKISIAGQL